MISGAINGRRVRLVTSLLAGMLVLFGCDTTPQSGIGSLAPDFQVESLQSGDIKTALKDFRGKVVILDYWATWCGPCKQITPSIEKLGQKYKDKGLVVMPISNEERRVLQAFETKNPHKSPIYVDTFDFARNALHVSSLPTLAVIGKRGHIVFQTSGFDEKTVPEMEAEIVKALAEKAD